MEFHGQMSEPEQLPADAPFKLDAGSGNLHRCVQTSDSSSDDSSTILAARPEQQAVRQSGPLGASAKISAEPGLVEFTSLEHSTDAELQQPKDLADVSHRLKKLEKAVKAYLLAGRTPGDPSILASAYGGTSILSTATTQQQSNSSLYKGQPGSCQHPGIARTSERYRLKESLSSIKSDVADLAVRQVEAQLLQQRVLRLEAAIGGIGSFIGPGAAVGLSSNFSSLAGSIMGAGAAVDSAAAGGAKVDATPMVPRKTSDVTVLVDRLADMEGVLKDLAQAQVANTAVLQQIGSRLPSPVPPSPDAHAYGAVPVGVSMMADASVIFRGSPGRPQPPRPPSAPLVGGILNSPFTNTPQPPRRAPSPDARSSSTCCINTNLFGSATNTTNNASFARSAASSATSPGAAFVHSATYPAISTSYSVQQQQQTAPNHQQQDSHFAWQQFEIVVAGHDAEIAEVKIAVDRLIQDQQTAADAAYSTGLQVSSLTERVMAIEQSRGAGGQLEVTLRPQQGQSDRDPDSSKQGTSAPATSNLEASVGALDQADVVSAIEGLAADSVQAMSRLDGLEGLLEQHGAAICSVQDTTDQLQEQLQQVSGTVTDLTAQVQHLHAQHPPATSVQTVPFMQPASMLAPASAWYQQMQQQVLQQLVNSDQLQQLVNARVEQLLKVKAPEAAAAQLAEASRCAANAETETAHEAVAGETGAKAAYANSQLQALLSEDSYSDEENELRPLVPVAFCSAPSVPVKLQAAFDALAERLQACTTHAAAGQAEVIQEALQHLHNRLVQVEELVAAEQVQLHQQKQQAVRDVCRSCPSAQTLGMPDAPISTGAGTSADTDPACNSQAAQEHIAGSGSAEAVVAAPLPVLGAADAPNPSADNSSSAANTAAADVVAVVPVTSVAACSRSASAEYLERQVAVLQQEMTAHQLTAMQEAVEDLSRQVASIQQSQTQHSALLDQQSTSTAAYFATLAPLEPRMCDLASQVAMLSQVAAQHPVKLEELRNDIEQISMQLAEVNERAAEEAEVDELKSEVLQLTQQQEQLQRLLESQAAAAEAAAAEAAAAEAAAAGEPASIGCSVGMLASLEASVQQQLASAQDALTKLQQEVEGRVAQAVAQAAAATAAVDSQAADAQLLSERAADLASKLAVLELAVAESKTAAATQLDEKVGQLQAETATHEAKLHQQVETMAQILADVGQAKAAQAEAALQLQQRLEALAAAHAQTAVAQSELQSSLSHQLTASAEQLRKELDSALEPLQQQLAAAAQQITEHETAIGSCAKATVLAGVVATLQGLPGAVKGLTSRLDELAQAQRAAEGQLNAAQEQHIVLNEQLTALQQYVTDMAATVDNQQEQLGTDVERISSKLLAPVLAELEQLKQQKEVLAAAQEHHADAVQQLGAAVDGVRDDVMAELVRSRDELAQSIEEMQTVISDRCLKTDQLGQIFAARDNMYGAWMKMQAVFESNKSHSGAAGRASSGALFRMRPSLTQSAGGQMLGATTSEATSRQALMACEPAGCNERAGFDPFSDMAMREQPRRTSRLSSTVLHDEAAAPVTPEVVIAASSNDQAEHPAAPTPPPAAVTAADLAAVLDGQFQLRETVAQLSKQLTALQQQTPAPTLKSEDVPLMYADPAAVAQLQATVAQLSQQVAGLMQVQQLNLVPAAQFEVQEAGSLDQHRTPASLALQQELASMLSRIADLEANMENQQLQASTVAPAGSTEVTTSESWVLLQQSVGALAATVEELQQQIADKPPATNHAHQEDQHKEVSAAVGVLHAPLSVVVQLQQELSNVKDGQVSKEQFSAVLRMVRELKDQVGAATEQQQTVSSQLADLLQQHSEQLAGVDFSVESLLQRLEATATASVEAVDSLNQQQQLQQLSSNEAVQQLSTQLVKVENDLAALQAVVEQQGVSQDAGSLSVQELTSEFMSQQGAVQALTADLAKLSASVDDLATKLASEREAHTQLASAVNAAAVAANLPRRAFSDGQETSGFSEVVAGIAKLKGYLDAQSVTLAGLQERLEAQESAVAQLAAAAQEHKSAAEAVLQGLNSTTPTEDADSAASAQAGHRTSNSGVLRSVNSKGAADSGSFVTKEYVEQTTAVLKTQLEDLQVKMAALQQQQQQQFAHMPQTVSSDVASGQISRSVSGSGRASPATTTLATIGTASPSLSRRVSKISSIAAADAIELTIAAADEAAVAVAGPITLVHQILMELKKRVEALERSGATSATASAPATGCVSTTADAQAATGVVLQHSNQLFVSDSAAAAQSGTRSATRRPAVWQAAGDAATVSELQEVVERLQQDVIRIDMESSSHAANISSLRGDLGAAAAAAAQAAAAAAAASSETKRSMSVNERVPEPSNDAAVAEEVSAACAAATAAQKSAAEAKTAVAAAQEGMRALAQELLQLQNQLVSSRSTAGTSSLDVDPSVAADVSAAVVLQQEVDSIKAQLAQLSDVCKSAVSSHDVLASQQAESAIKIQRVEEQLQSVAKAATYTSETAAAESAVRYQERLQQVELDMAAVKGQIASFAAASGSTAAAELVSQLRTQVQELQDQVAWASSEAAAAASTAATNAVEELQAQFDDLQSQVGRAVERSMSTATPAAAANAAVDAADMAVPASAADTAMPPVKSTFSFNELAAAPSPASRALVQQLFANVAGEIGPAVKQAEQTAATAEGTWFNPVFDEAPPQQQQQPAEPAQQQCGPAEAGGFGSLMGDVTAAAAVDVSSQQLLGAQLGLLSPAHQVEFLTKLAGVVSSHAARLLATYQDEPALAAQLQQVQERLSTLVAGAGAACKAARFGDSSPAAAAGFSRRYSSSTSISLRSSTTQASDTAACASGSAVGEVLLGILDQVASLRAIGSATHPAVSQALQKHEAQIAALLEAQQQLVSQQQPAGAAGQDHAQVQECASASSILAEPDVAADCVAGLSSNSGSGSSSEAFEGENNQRLSALESKLSAGLKALAEVRGKFAPLREVADATQSMMRELQVAHGLVLQRLEALEELAAGGVGPAAQAAAEGQSAAGKEEAVGGALAVAGALRKLQNDVLNLTRRLSSAEAALTSAADCLSLSRKLAARMADADGRGAQLAGKVSSVASSLPVVVERVVELEGRLNRSLGVARRGLDILADQLVALGQLNGRGSPNKNPLAALGPNHAAITALEGKVEAVRTAMTASVRLMMSDLATESAAAGSTTATPGLSQAELGSGVVAAQLAASEALNAATASHQDALNSLENTIAELRAEMYQALAVPGRQAAVEL